VSYLARLPWNSDRSDFYTTGILLRPPGPTSSVVATSPYTLVGYVYVISVEGQHDSGTFFVDKRIPEASHEAFLRPPYGLLKRSVEVEII
jgi:hypothetical protein